MASINGIQQKRGSNGELPTWTKTLLNYQNPSGRRAGWQLVNTFLPYCALWFLMVRSVQGGYPYSVTLLLAVAAAAFLVRLFILFHDCVHGSLFPWRRMNNFFGHIIGVLVFTPFEDWRMSHLRHHATYANLDTRGFGDIWTMTRAEYDASSKRTRLLYRVYRNPIVLCGLGVVINFMLANRIPTRKMRRRERMSVVFTNVLIVGVAMAAAWFMGWRTYFLIQLPVAWIAGAAGIWLFYVQHQFEGVYWARKEEWKSLRAAMEGSSYYKLPALLRWFSSNIGYHHVHHLNSRIPNYRLKQCFDAVPELHAREPLTIRKSLSSIRLKLWDEEHGELVGFR
jgi:omega-6 fatty acid desaturase (delta-12 desaturase)